MLSKAKIVIKTIKNNREKKKRERWFFDEIAYPTKKQLEELKKTDIIFYRKNEQK